MHSDGVEYICLFFNFIMFEYFCLLFLFFSISGFHPLIFFLVCLFNSCWKPFFDMAQGVVLRWFYAHAYT